MTKNDIKAAVVVASILAAACVAFEAAESGRYWLLAITATWFLLVGLANR